MQQTLSFSPGKPITLMSHILVWAIVGVGLFFDQPMWLNSIIPLQFWIKNFVLLGLLVAAFYLNAYVLVPRFLFKDRTREFVALLLLTLAAVLLLLSVTDTELRIPQLVEAAFKQHRPPPHAHGRHFDFPLLVITALILGVSTTITAIQKWQTDQQLRRELEQQKTISELSFLKAQINPHFFFNTLNNIYALTAVDAQSSGKAIHKLSRMMRYLLYETEHQSTLLSKEIGFISDYIELMQLRLSDKVSLLFDTPARLNDVELAPMLFLPLVENAFKHGVSSLQPSNIHISIKQDQSLLILKVRNTLFADLPSGRTTESSGIGLANTRRRLDLLYPERYRLEVNPCTTDLHYEVQLTLSLQ
ncbi:histidine kinase [Mucilaginibacter yixingensis]|uniref:Histidine kinase n=2 Tax=Mucilaginibacter yixingensis TaxID=1295612 RepID=A0A2T5JBG7_9SPHI|nr:histidine kinase [Mucilaginibacter yixingensis]